MHQILLLPVLFPILCGTAMLILRPEGRRVRNVFLMAAVCITSGLSAACILLTYRLGGDATTCVMVNFSRWLSLSLKIDGVSMVYGGIVTVLWPIVRAAFSASGSSPSAWSTASPSPRTF